MVLDSMLAGSCGPHVVLDCILAVELLQEMISYHNQTPNTIEGSSLIREYFLA